MGSYLETQNKVLGYDSEACALRCLDFMTHQQMDGWGLNNVIKFKKLTNILYHP